MENVRREALGVRWKRPWENYTGHLPMARDRVLPGRHLTHLTVASAWCRRGRHAAYLQDVAKPQSAHCGQVQTSHGLRGVRERIAAAISIVAGIRKLPRSHAIQNDN